MASPAPKTTAWVVTLLLLALFGLPGVRHMLGARRQAQDSFPVSTFPMFSKPRAKEHRMTWVRARDAHGKLLGQVPSGIYDRGGMNQAMAHLKRVRPNQPARRQAICAEIARAVRRSKRPPGAALIEIVDAYYLPEKVFGAARDETPEHETVLVTCPVERATPPPSPA